MKDTSRADPQLTVGCFCLFPSCVLDLSTSHYLAFVLWPVVYPQGLECLRQHLGFSKAGMQPPALATLLFKAFFFFKEPSIIFPLFGIIYSLVK